MCRHHNLQQIIHHRICYRNLPHQRTRRQKPCAVKLSLKRWLLYPLCQLHDFPQLLLRGKSNQNFEHKTVKLCLRQGIRSFTFYWILCRKHKKGFCECVAFISDSHSMLLHCLKQCGLCFGRGTVDFICQYQIGKYWPPLKGKRTSPLIFDNNIRARHVTWHQIRRKLNAFERQLKNLCDRADKPCLAQSRHSLQQYISPCQHGNHHLTDNLVLADHSLLNFQLTGCNPLRYIPRILQQILI